MSLKIALEQFDDIEAKLESGDMNLQHAQVALASVIWNNKPNSFIHPSDVNYVDLIGSRLHESVENIIYCELEDNYINKALEIVEFGRTEVTRIYNEYVPKC